jgi:hypothetical protein
MAWITIPVVCTIEDLQADEIRKANTILENLNLPIKELPPPQFEVREARVNTLKIGIYYPSHNAEKTILECYTGNYSVCLTVKQLDLLIAKAEGHG